LKGKAKGRTPKEGGSTEKTLLGEKPLVKDRQKWGSQGERGKEEKKAGGSIRV